MIDKPSPIAKFLVLSAAFVVVVSGLKMAGPLLVPFLLAVFIAMIVSPLLNWLKARKVPGGIAIVLIVALVFLVGLLLAAVIGSSVESFRQDIPVYSTKLSDMSTEVQQWLSLRGIDINAQQWQSSFDPGAVMGLVGSTLASFGNVMTNAVMILLTVVFILAENMSFGEKLRLARGADKSQAWLVSFSDAVHSYLAIKAAISLVTGILIFIWLSVLGVDYAVLWGLLAFLLNFIPTVGSFIAAVPAVLLALVQLGLLHAGLTLAGFVMVNLVMGNAVEPRWMGKGLNLSPLVVFVSLVLWGWVFGPVGMLLSIPLTIMIKIALENQPDTRWIGVMMGDAESSDQASDQQPV
ncbi:MAG: AI-2E family transporter [Porticoccaceae bacterium]|jgi:AI-2 transport protein TqsA|nr:AI-2E family transporter [Porticoccaceae bacterium]MBT5578459.1 AI-2E family transporter [Porticoccaceae bacterium]MBT7374841.1 AI-2E family transporter [Porticoccaceae bacterium]